MVEKGGMPNGLAFEYHLNTGQPNHLNIGHLKLKLCIISYFSLFIGDLNTGLVWHSNGQKLFDCQMVRHLNATWITNYHLNTIQDESLFFRCFCYSDVRYSDPHYYFILPSISVLQSGGPHATVSQPVLALSANFWKLKACVTRNHANHFNILGWSNLYFGRIVDVIKLFLEEI